MAKAGYYRKHGEDAPLVLSPGQIAGVKSSQNGPYTEVMRGLSEKPGSPSAIQHMTEADKLQYTHASHVYQNSLDAKEKAQAAQVIDFLNSKYGVFKTGPDKTWSMHQAKLVQAGFSPEKIREFGIKHGFIAPGE